MSVIYFMIAFAATFFGALVGLGGGVIIKPMLDLISPFDAMTISALSSLTVFFMTIIAIFSNLKNGITIDRKLWPVAVGGVVGGYLGKGLLTQFIAAMSSDAVAKGIQATLLGALMIVVFILMKSRLSPIEKSHSVSGFAIGLTLGLLSSFLGIGGGPLNVIALVMLCGLDKKYAAFGSVFLIFASQGTKVLTLFAQGQTHLFNSIALFGLIPGAIVGAYFGSKLYRRLAADVVVIIFSISVIALALLNFGVAYRSFFS